MTFVIAWIGLATLVLFSIVAPTCDAINHETTRENVGFPVSEKGNECASTSLRGSNESGWR